MIECPIAETTGPCWKQNNLDTDSSLNRSQGPQHQQLVSAHLSKKRIGPYSYKLNDVIGSGFSSVVYRGYKDNDKSQIVAIKVVQLQGMRAHRRLLLEKEIKILKMLEHPNILAFRDLYWTANNCYIVTEYCEGGNLQRIVQQDPHFDWRQAAYEVSIACQYLASLNIIHRDVKPANILLKNGVFKLSDFGFSLIVNSSEPIQERYLIGSPLYMPLESLSDHLYSTKSDSFALGVLLFYLCSRRFPWKGKNKDELVSNYRTRKCNKSGIAHLAPRVKHLIHSLLEMQAQKRASLCECDFSVFLHLGPSRSINCQLQKLKDCSSEQVTLCQFINSLKQNAIYFEWANHYILEFITRHLKSLVLIFQWHKRSDLTEISQQFGLAEQDPKFASDDYFWINNCLKDTISLLREEEEDLTHMMLEQLLKYQQIIEAIIFEPHQEVLFRINLIRIPACYTLSQPDHNYIRNVLPKIDFYQL